MAEQDKCQFEQYLEERKAEAEAKARKYLYSEKERKPYFTFTGIDDTDDPEEMIYSTNSLHVDLPHIIQLFINTYNKQNPSDGPVDTIDELCKKCHLCELRGIDSELDKFFEFFDDLGMLLYEVDPEPHYYYDMSYYFWNSSKLKMSKRYTFSSDLSDEEYIYLLTDQLLNRNPDTFNRLVFDNPDLANKICGDAEIAYFDDTDIGGNPYLIIFDEVLDDVEAIDGPSSVSETLYYDVRLKSKYCLCAHTEGRKLTICENDWSETIPMTELRNLENIDADKVQNKLRTRNYAQMLDAMKSRFNTPSAFDDIRAWLDSEQLAYTESKGQLSNSVFNDYT